MAAAPGLSPMKTMSRRARAPTRRATLSDGGERRSRRRVSPSKTLAAKTWTAGHRPPATDRRLTATSAAAAAHFRAPTETGAASRRPPTAEVGKPKPIREDDARAHMLDDALIRRRPSSFAPQVAPPIRRRPAGRQAARVAASPARANFTRPQLRERARA